ncbi:MAG: hypothetical protein IPG87_10945 [Saprospiraceae bacterium]|nr:hypothetical protein [Candidatus Vicinibacter affinis]
MLNKNILFCIAMSPCLMNAQQVADLNFNPVIRHPEYEPSKGSIIYIDEGHHNFHTKEGRFKPFANLVESDGYKVIPYKGNFLKTELDKGKILVISNALHESNVNRWVVPNPSAFTESEIKETEQWVKEGGSLFLIADHMPLAGASKDLAAAFRFEFTNGFALDTNSNGSSLFSFNHHTLHKNTITLGRDSSETVTQIATFTGQAFKIPPDATPILTFDKQYVNKLPDTAWVFNSKTTQYSIEGWSQGACKKYGKGKIVVFGEAAMFTAQLAGPNKRPIGMNSPDAQENHQLLLNIIHWLDGRMD